MSDYAVCKARGEVEGDFEMYLRNPPPGKTGWSINRHARDESSDVKSNPKYARPRMLPVPAAVDPSGVVLMVAHVKIAKAGMISPRLHYYDDTSHSGNVYVGYIGRHLPTQQGS